MTPTFNWVREFKRPMANMTPMLLQQRGTSAMPLGIPLMLQRDQRMLAILTLFKRDRRSRLLKCWSRQITHTLCL